MKQKTDGEFQTGFGKMVRGINSILLGENELSDTQNMRPGFWWKQRKGMATLTATPVASGLRWKRMTQFRNLAGTTDVLLAHTYDSSGLEDLYQGSALPPNAITWTKKYDLTAGCETSQFANVAEAVLLANNKDFLIWRGTSHKPTGVWFYDVGNTEYINFYDEMTDGDTSTLMVLDSMTTTDFVYVLSEMPLDTINWVLTNYNGTSNSVIIKKWNGAWVALTVTDGTSKGAGETLPDDFTGVTFDSNRWTETDTSDDLSCNNEYIYNTDGGIAFIDTDGKVELLGDFDISVAFSLGTQFDDPGTGTNYHMLKVYQTTDPADNYTHVRMENGGTQRYQMYGEVGGVTESVVTANSSDMTGFLRMTRIDAEIKCYYGSATAGTLIGTYTGQYTGAVYVELYSVTGMDANSWDGPATFDDLVANVATYAEASLGQDGAMSWTVATDEEKTMIEGIPGYAYQVSFDVALDAEVEVNQMTVHSPWNPVKNIWDGTLIPPTGCYVYDGTKYVDSMAYVNNTSQSQYCDLSGASTSYKWYIGFSQQVNEIKIWPTEAEFNDADCQIATIKYMKNTGALTTVGTVTDSTQVGTDMLQQKGSFKWVAPTDEVASKIAGDDAQMFWYEVVIDANTLSDPCYVYYIQGIPVPEDPDYSYGVFAYKRRAWQIAPRGDENAVRYSSQDLPNVWSGPDTGYIYFGERPLRAAAPFYNESVIYADTEIWMLQGNTPANFGRLRLSGKVGISAPHSLVSIESGAPVGDKIKVVLGWFFYDGIWLFDGTRIWKVSDPDVASFFDPDHADYINMTYMDQTQGEYDFETQCAYWIVYSGSGQTTPNKVIIMHFPTMTFGVYDYGVDIGALCAVINTRYYICAGGHACGRFFQLNDGTTDRNSANAEVAVDAYVTTRDMSTSISDGMKQRLFSVWAESQAAGGLIEVDQYPDGSDTPQPIGKASLTTLGKIASIFQWPLKFWNKQALVKFRIRNRSKNARMNLIGHSTTVDKGRSDQ